MKSTTFRSLVVALPIIACALAFTVYAQAPASPTSSQGSAEYRNDKFQFSLGYPADMAVTEQNAAGGGQTISFMSTTTGKEFEILAIPYAQVDIAAGAFTPHDAYGTADQGLWLRDVNVVEDGGVQQFWFVKTGVMYEVLGMKGDEAWLINILKTWQFD
jgi:hypothetical protein